MGRLHDLYEQHGQSPWLDDLRRGWLTGGELERWVQAGVRGVTSNPSIFQRSIAQTNDYDEQFAELVRSGASVEDAYWELVIADVRGALEVLAPVHDGSGGLDGYVSVEVAPGLAFDTAGTVAAARRLHERLAAPNLYVKIPGTPPGLPAIRQMITEGRSVNVTLIFALDRYEDVMEAYIAGLEAREGDLSGVSSVASFFVSRVDTEVDRRLEAIGTPQARALAGRAALAQAQLAYQRFLARFSGARWEALAARGARPQRPLWASTSTKNPAYPDTMYVDRLIGPRSVNTMPAATLEAFVDHGTLARTIDADPAAARRDLDLLAEVGVDFGDVGRTLEDQGVAAFAKSFDELLDALAARSDAS